jgi:type IV pilus assembly protein PilV
MNNTSMKRIPMILKNPAQSSRGFSLLEVMIALLVLSIGLLGLAGLQTFSLKFNHQSYERTQATLLIYDIMDRITANPIAARAGNFDNVPAGSMAATYVALASCQTTGCSTSDLANYDLNSWKLQLETSKVLAQGTGAVTRLNPGDLSGCIYDVTVTWVENDITMRQTMRVRTI